MGGRSAASGRLARVARTERLPTAGLRAGTQRPRRLCRDARRRGGRRLRGRAGDGAGSCGPEGPERRRTAPTPVSTAGPIQPPRRRLWSAAIATNSRWLSPRQGNSRRRPIRRGLPSSRPRPTPWRWRASSRPRPIRLASVNRRPRRTPWPPRVASRRRPTRLASRQQAAQANAAAAARQQQAQAMEASRTGAAARPGRRSTAADTGGRARVRRSRLSSNAPPGAARQAQAQADAARQSPGRGRPARKRSPSHRPRRKPVRPPRTSRWCKPRRPVRLRPPRPRNAEMAQQAQARAQSQAARGRRPSTASPGSGGECTGRRPREPGGRPGQGARRCRRPGKTRTAEEG